MTDDRMHGGGDDGGRAAQIGRVQGALVDQARADVDRVRAAAEAYAEAFHRSGSCSASERARLCTLCRPVSTTRSATSR